ncbi:MAG TPA: VWA domain-containing protein [Acidimicrobiales bacterium]|nr:VWA domain-containing protein [Acidimicrobiales bacterium]
MLDVLSGFVDELRASGLPVSVTETIDAANALSVIPLDDVGALRAALGTTLVKSADHEVVFARVFDLFFARRNISWHVEGEILVETELPGTEEVFVPGKLSGDRRAIDPMSLRDMVREAIAKGDERLLAESAAHAVELYGAVGSARPVGVAYYLQKTLRGLDLESILSELLEALLAHSGNRDRVREGHLGGNLLRNELSRHADALREEIRREIVRLLVNERGAGAVAKSMRRPLVEDLDFMHANGDDLVAMRKAIYPLARILASRLAHRRRHRRRGPLDVRATIRRSLSSGGVPLEPRFKNPHPSRPEIFVLADVSGSVSAFARFTVHLVYAIAEQFSNVRCAVFIDGVDDVTGIFRRASSIEEAIAEVGAQADVVDAHGHSNYGNAFRLFAERYGQSLTKKTNLIILGDARGNYHSGEAEILQRLRRRSHRVFWLNPEPRSYWGTGDSIIGEYAPHCDGVFECRTLRQLKEFVNYLA